MERKERGMVKPKAGEIGIGRSRNKTQERLFSIIIRLTAMETPKLIRACDIADGNAVLMQTYALHISQRYL